MTDENDVITSTPLPTHKSTTSLADALHNTLHNSLQPSSTHTSLNNSTKTSGVLLSSPSSSTSSLHSLSTSTSDSTLSQASAGSFEISHSAASYADSPLDRPLKNFASPTHSSSSSNSTPQSQRIGISKTSVLPLASHLNDGPASIPHGLVDNVEILDQASPPTLAEPPSPAQGLNVSGLGLHSLSNGHNESTFAFNKTDNHLALIDEQSQPFNHTPSDESHTSPTTTQKSYPAFLPPAGNPNDQTEGCNAYGPLCQTGSAVVGVNRTGTVITTTVPCSSFLSAHAVSVRADKTAFSSWRASFGRSPQCTSYARHDMSGGVTEAPDWLSSCGKHATALPPSDVFSTRNERSIWLQRICSLLWGVQDFRSKG